ncbi:hypothetical protein Tco_0865075 [Tanacetum coccineum]
MAKMSRVIGVKGGKKTTSTFVNTAKKANQRARDSIIPDEVSYGKRQILDNLHKIEEELELNFSKPLDLLKTSVQFADHRAGTVLNEPSLGMILFNFSKRQDFISIEYFEELNNEMLYYVKEIFFRLHQGPG